MLKYISGTADPSVTTTTTTVKPTDTLQPAKPIANNDPRYPAYKGIMDLLS